MRAFQYQCPPSYCYSFPTHQHYHKYRSRQKYVPFVILPFPNVDDLLLLIIMRLHHTAPYVTGTILYCHVDDKSTVRYRYRTDRYQIWYILSLEKTAIKNWIILLCKNRYKKIRIFLYGTSKMYSKYRKYKKHTSMLNTSGMLIKVLKVNYAVKFLMKIPPVIIVPAYKYM